MVPVCVKQEQTMFKGLRQDEVSKVDRNSVYQTSGELGFDAVKDGQGVRGDIYKI